ncbi:hypothetical protein LCGC14_2776610, partial [marine sediment metagenome]
MHVDHFMEIGSSHKVCEDYILSGMDPVPHVILADGCSSSENTDVGARLLCYVAKQYLNVHLKAGIDLNWETAGRVIIHETEEIAWNMGLNANALDATLIMAWVEDNFIRVFMYGDGHIIFMRKTDVEECSVYHQETNFRSNAPYYLSYSLDSEKRKQYEDLFGIKDGKNITQYIKTGSIWNFDYDYDFSADK